MTERVKISREAESMSISQIKKWFEEHGFKVFQQEPYQKTAEIDGQIIELSFTNANMVVLLQKTAHGWNYVERDFKGKKAEGMLRRNYYFFRVLEEKEEKSRIRN